MALIVYNFITMVSAVDCAICQFPLGQSNTLIHGKHAIHQDCMRSWAVQKIKENNQIATIPCPLCREELPIRNIELICGTIERPASDDEANLVLYSRAEEQGCLSVVRCAFPTVFLVISIFAFTNAGIKQRSDNPSEASLYFVTGACSLAFSICLWRCLRVRC